MATELTAEDWELLQCLEEELWREETRFRGFVAWILDLYGMKTNIKKSKESTMSNFMRQLPHLMIRRDTKPWIQQAMRIGGCG